MTITKSRSLKRITYEGGSPVHVFATHNNKVVGIQPKGSMVVTVAEDAPEEAKDELISGFGRFGVRFVRKLPI